jgi:FkbM family methyltransferase
MTLRRRRAGDFLLSAITANCVDSARVLSLAPKAINMKDLLRHLRTLRIEVFWVIHYAGDMKSTWTLVKDLVSHRLMKLSPMFSTNQLRSINVRGGAHISYRLNRADRRSLQEIWMERAYQTPALGHSRTLVDVGANIGLASIWLAYEYGFSQIIAVEPSVENIAVLRKNFDENGIAPVILEAALGAQDGTGIFDPGPSPTNGRLVEKEAFGDHSPRARSVQVCSMDTVLDMLPPGTMIDLLKMDIEGGEQHVFTNNLEWLKRVRAIVVEFHRCLADVPALRENLFRNKFRSVSVLETGTDFMEVFINDALAVNGNE